MNCYFAINGVKRSRLKPICNNRTLCYYLKALRLNTIRQHTHPMYCDDDYVLRFDFSSHHIGVRYDINKSSFVVSVCYPYIGCKVYSLPYTCASTIYTCLSSYDYN